MLTSELTVIKTWLVAFCTSATRMPFVFCNTADSHEVWVRADNTISTLEVWTMRLRKVREFSINWESSELKPRPGFCGNTFFPCLRLCSRILFFSPEGFFPTWWLCLGFYIPGACYPWKNQPMGPIHAVSYKNVYWRVFSQKLTPLFQKLTPWSQSAQV